MKSLIVYFSRTGNTKKVAEIIKENTDADIKEIVDNKNTKGVFGFIKAIWEVLFKVSTTIEDININLDEYDAIYIGTPVWANGLPPAMKCFFNKYKLEGKNISIFVTTASSGGEVVINQVKKHISNNNFGKEIILKSNMLKNEESLKQEMEMFVSGC